MDAGRRAGGGQGVPGPSPSVLAALGRMTQQPKQRQRQEESAEGGRRVVGGEHQEEEKPEGRAAPPAGPEGTARLGARPVGEDEGILVVPFSGGRLAPTAAGNNPLGSQPAGQGWAPPHATSVSCPAPVATPSSASAHGTALPPIHTSCRPTLLRTRGPAWALHLVRQPHLLPREPLYD